MSDSVRDDLAGRQAAEISGHGGRADIDGEAVDLLHLSRKDGEDLPFHPDGRGDRPVSLPEGAGKAEEGGIVDLRALQAEPLREGRNQPLIVSQGIVQSRGGEGLRERGGRRDSAEIAFSDASFLTTCLPVRLSSGTKIRTSPRMTAAQARRTPSARSFSPMSLPSSSVNGERWSGWDVMP